MWYDTRADALYTGDRSGVVRMLGRLTGACRVNHFYRLWFATVSQLERLFFIIIILPIAPNMILCPVGVAYNSTAETARAAAEALDGEEVEFGASPVGV